MQEDFKPDGYTNDPAEILIINAELKAKIARKKREAADAELDKKLESVRSDPRNNRFKKKKKEENE